MKICSKCGILKPLSEFRLNSKKSGLRRECKVCESILNKICRSKPERRQCACRKTKNWRLENKERVKISSYEYRKYNLGKILEWKRQHSEVIREYNRKATVKRRSTCKGKLDHNISNLIYLSLKKGSKQSRHWEDLVGYTINQLKEHLEEKFISEMNWDNQGRYWHIDHKIPISAFNFSCPEDIDFRRCWALSNLQPLEARKNISKGCRLVIPFQPSLQIQI